ncbi:DUF5696 domain-containing protein [Gracilibacillus sp. D59]|uniref:DUF5696 domain-containing protein n=1 Tax=Gracilibacillus sp. D59 TaxID=3457434 RepID=UPI003FCE6BD1
MKLLHKHLIKFLIIILMFSVIPLNSSAEEASEKTGNVKEQSDEATNNVTENSELGKETMEAATPQIKESGELFPITATKKVAENDVFELYVDESNGNLRIKNKKTEEEWLGSPQVDKNTLPNNKSYIDSPVHITYTDGSSISSTYTLKDANNKQTFEVIENGIKVTFDIAELQMTFDLEYRLTEDGIEISVPFDSIKEEGSVRLISLAVLPYFHAAKESDNGAVFIPDGSGALMTFKEKHPVYFSGYSQPVYGPDHAFADELGGVLAGDWRHADAPKEKIALPVFGLYKNDSAFLGIITEGAEAARINATPSGIRNIPLYNTGVEFMYRKQDITFIGSSGQIPLFQANKINGDRKVRYILLEDEKAEYVGMAQAYRDYLIKNVGLQEKGTDSIPLSIDILGGIKRDEILGSTFIEMTTFEQIREMIDKYANKGIQNIEFNLKGWGEDGLYGNQPKHFPIERKIGGKKELKELLDYANKKGVSIYLQTNYVRPFQKSDGMKERTDTIRGINREVMTSPNWFVSSRYSNTDETFFLLKPDKALEYMKEEIDDFSNLDIAGIHFEHIGNMLYSDQDPNHPSTRAQAADTWRESLELYDQKVKNISIDYGFAYTLGIADRIKNIPMDSSHFVYIDKTIPFYQIVLHGLIPYTSQPSNLRDDQRFELLRAIEYGALPNFELTYAPASNLQRTIEDRLFSSEFDYWFEESIEEYEKFVGIFNDIQNQTIVDHEELDSKVFRTTYANGMQVIVNYNRKQVSVGGQVIAGYDYAVVEGEMS